MPSGAKRSKLWVATPLIAGLTVAVVCAIGYLELAEDLALSPKIAAFDAQLSAIVRSWRTPGLTVAFSAATWSANMLTITAIVLVAVAVLVWRCDHREALLVALIIASGAALGALAKRVAERPRPPVAAALVELPPDYSFPSGHTLAALLLWTVIAVAVLRVGRRGWVRALVVVGGLLLVVLVGTSRVYLGVHWPSDILASWLLGVAWLAVTLGGFLTWERAVGPIPR